MAWREEFVPPSCGDVGVRYWYSGSAVERNERIEGKLM